MHRYQQLPKNIEQTMETMRSGIAKNLTAHLASMQVHYQKNLQQKLNKSKAMQILKFNPELATQVWPSQKQNVLDSDNDNKTLFRLFLDKSKVI